MKFIDEEWVKANVHHRDAKGHKKSFGHVLVIAGSEGKAGAAILCARAALHSGCGMVTAMIPAIATEVLLQQEPEIMYMVESDIQNADLSSFDAIAIGPGMGFSSNAISNLLFLLTNYKGPLIIDADALVVLADHLTLIKSNHILTPHPGEFSKLKAEVYDALNRAQEALNFVEKYPCVLVLKGEGTIVGTGEEGLLQNTTGNDGMATAGTGDVLTGIITSLCAQGYSPINAACIGVYIHGLAGDLAILEQSKSSLVASDLIHYLGKINLLD